MNQTIFQPYSSATGAEVFEAFGFGAIVEVLSHTSAYDGSTTIHGGSRGILLGVDSDRWMIEIEFAEGIGKNTIEPGHSGLRKIT